MAPIRVGVIGLKGIDGTSIGPHNWAVVAFLPTLLHSPDYELVAVCNSTVESAQQAIQVHKLPASTKAYGDPQDLADDDNVDMVIVSVMVTKHVMLAEPALLKKKKVLVEWPLAHTTKHAEALADIARQNDLKTIVGVQARADPLVVKAKEIIESGQLGKITSTSVLGATCGLPSHAWFKGVEYYLKMDNGANMYHVYFAHFLDSFLHVLGDFDTLQSFLKAENTEVPVLGDDGKPEAFYKKDAPDHVLVQGVLNSGVVASIAYRWTHLNEAVGDVGIRWIISGTKGEMEITTDQSQWQIFSPKSKLRIKLNGKGNEEVTLPNAHAGFAKEVHDSGVNTANILDAFAKGDTERYADFDSALQTHRLLDRIVEKSGFTW